jgi:hypothetical protein
MASYRQPSPPGVTRIELRTHDPKKLMTGMLLLIGGALAFAMLASMLAVAVVPRNLQPLVIAATMGVMGLGFTVGLLLAIKRLWELRFYLDIGDASIRLIALNGECVADTMRGNLTFTKVSYTRRGRHGASWIRPGFAMRHPGGDHLVGTLLPEDVWAEGEAKGHDPRMPEFELRRPDFEALRARVPR